MTDTWIVGMDGSAAAERAVDWAVAHAAGRDVTLRIVAAWEVPALARLSGLRMSSGVDRAGIEATAAYTVDSTLERIEADGLAATGEVIEGDPRSVLLGTTAAAELLVVGRRGTSTDPGPLHLGSVSRHCATHAGRPVVVVPEGAPIVPTADVVVGMDDSDHARQALRWAITFAPSAAAITAIRAFEVVPWLGPESTEERFAPEIAEAAAAFEADVDEIDPEHRVTRRLEVGDPRDLLADAALGAGLLALGGRGHRGLTAAVMGSVTTWLLQHVGAPTVVMPT